MSAKVTRRPVEEQPRYELYDEIASGGMASVFFGRLLAPAGFSRVVAIKKLHPQFARDPEFSAMLRDEARMASRVRHANVVSTLDVVEDGRELLLVMEYVAGEALSRLLATAGAWSEPVPVEVAVAVSAGILHGLHAAHEARSDRGEPLELVHRDVSPQNILIGADGVPRLVDFGVAKAVGRCQATREGELKGKLAYMAPEQCRGEPATRRSDIWSASAVAWEMLTGRRLFDGISEPQIFGQVLSQRIQPPGKLIPAIPPELDAVILRGLRRAPDQRFATAREMALELESCIRPATASEVGMWVARLAGSRLDDRARRVADIERGGATFSGAAADVSRPGPPRWPWLLAAGMAIATIGLGTRARHGRGAVELTRSMQAVSDTIGVMAAALPPAEEEDLASAQSPRDARSAAAATGTEEPAAAAEPSAAATHRPKTPGAPMRKPPGKSKPSSSGAQATSARDERCYTLDANGVWHIRPECL
jgi:serine/threonine-protein kinase